MSRRSVVVMVVLAALTPGLTSAADGPPFVRWDADGAEIGVMLEVGYQFSPL